MEGEERKKEEGREGQMLLSTPAPGKSTYEYLVSLYQNEEHKSNDQSLSRMNE